MTLEAIVSLAVGSIALLLWIYTAIIAPRVSPKSILRLRDATSVLHTLALNLAEVSSFSTWKELRTKGLKEISKAYPSLPYVAIEEILHSLEEKYATRAAILQEEAEPPLDIAA